MSMLAPTVSIIIPAYNAECSISKTLDSILDQTYLHIEVIIVNDSSSDSTQVILEKYKNKFIRKGYGCKVLLHTENSGVAAARNTGLDNSTGDYVYFVDADDFMAIEAVSTMVEGTCNGAIDIVGCNWYLKLKNGTREMMQPIVLNGVHAIELMSKGIMKWNLWLFLVKRDLYEDNSFRFIVNQNMGEDILMMFRLFMRSNSVKSLDKPLYYYDKSNDQSLTNVYSRKHRDEVSLNLEEIDKLIVDSNKIGNWPELFNFLKLNIKLPLLISDVKENYKDWYYWFAESNAYILKNDKISKRIKLLQYMAWHKQFWAVKLHYYLIIRFVYRVLYK